MEPDAKKRPSEKPRSTDEVLHARKLAQRLSVAVAAITVGAGALAVYGVAHRKRELPPPVAVQRPMPAPSVAPETVPPSPAATPTTPTTLAQTGSAGATPTTPTVAAAVPTPAAPSGGATPAAPALGLTSAKIDLGEERRAIAPRPPGTEPPPPSIAPNVTTDPRAAHETAAEVAADLASVEVDLARAQQAGDKALISRLEDERKDVIRRLGEAVEANARNTTPTAPAPGAAPQPTPGVVPQPTPGAAPSGPAPQR